MTFSVYGTVRIWPINEAASEAGREATKAVKKAAKGKRCGDKRHKEKKGKKKRDVWHAEGGQSRVFLLATSLLILSTPPLALQAAAEPVTIQQ